MAGVSLREKHEFNVDNEYTDRFINLVNTILAGTIESIIESKAVINIENQYAKLMKDGNIKYISYGKITTNFVCLSLFKYVPKPGDKVIVLIFQSDVQRFLNNSTQQYPSRFNLYDSIVIPISLFYSDETKVEIGDSSLDMDINAKNLVATVEDFTVDSTQFNVNTSSTTIQTDKFSVIDKLTSDNLLIVLSTVLNAIGLVPVGTQTIDQITGGAVTVATTKLTAFS